MTAICDWGWRGDLEVFFGKDIIVDETVSGSVNMRGGYSSYLFVAIYPLSPGDVMDRGSERRPPPEALGSEREESLFRAALGLANGVRIQGPAVTSLLPGDSSTKGPPAENGVSDSGANETQPTAISIVQ
jgi:hypothetical protein